MIALEAGERERLFPKQTVLSCYRGSIAHGMYNPQPGSIDDVDLVAVYIPGLEHYIGLNRRPARGGDVKLREFDVAQYELRHFCELLAQANPNVMATLWLKPNMYLSNPGFDWICWRLILERDMFSSLHAYNSFSGYAYGQLKRMTSFKDSGEEACCVGELHHSPECPLRAIRGRGAHKKYATGFMGAKRKGLVVEFGYDTKNAAHLIRLLRMGIEFLDTGQLLVDRTAIDADELLRIKYGEWSLQRVQDAAGKSFELLARARERSKLPEQPDKTRIEYTVMHILKEHFKIGA